MYAIGIDLGTTNSVAAVFRKGQKESVQIDGQVRLPSVVSFRKGQTSLIGQAAKSRLLIDPESTVSSSKRFMGDRTKFYNIDGNSYSPVDIAALILRRLFEGAQASVASLGYELSGDAVITVPAYFTDDQRADTRRAGEQVGLNVTRLLPEPSAAAISYGLNKNRDQTIMVYDLGGGTFDISILQVQRNDFRVVAVGGDSMLGGDDFDNAIASWAAKEFERKYRIDLLRGREYSIARQRLKEAAENAKKELSESDLAEIVIPELVGRPLELELHIDKFNELTRPLLKKTIDCMHQVLREARFNADQIDRVILVGGSTRIRAVREIVAREIKEPYCDESPDEAVAWGAAIVASSLSAPDEDLAPDIVVSEVTAHSLGVGMLDERDVYTFHPMIPKNTRYPTEAGLLGATVDPFQTAVVIKVFRGEHTDPEQNQCLGELFLRVNRLSSKSVPIAAMFKLDEDGILKFKIVDIPFEGNPNPAIALLLDKALKNKSKIDVEMLESLIESRVLPQPEELKIDIR